jgi:hypothetical protein
VEEVSEEQTGGACSDDADLGLEAFHRGGGLHVSCSLRYTASPVHTRGSL